jgi:hypothetical protein
MRFWIRELAGWLLLALGLLVFYVCLVLLLDSQGPRIIEVGPLTLIGIIIFRGGIHFLKVAVAARVCLHAQAEMKAQRAGTRLAATRERSAGPETALRSRVVAKR